jgi:hypothetical protein
MIKIGYVSFTLKEEERQDQLEKKIGMIIWSYLFNNWELVGKPMRDGFLQAFQHALASTHTKENMLKAMRHLILDTPHKIVSSWLL